ncbi:hypothetical protein Tco_0292214 [Tanacetum coccineum]
MPKDRNMCAFVSQCAGKNIKVKKSKNDQNRQETEETSDQEKKVNEDSIIKCQGPILTSFKITRAYLEVSKFKGLILQKIKVAFKEENKSYQLQGLSLPNSKDDNKGKWERLVYKNNKDYLCKYAKLSNKARLSNHKAEIICHEKVVRISLDGKVLRVLGERPEEKARHLMSAKAKEQKQEEMVMVRDFPKVFPDDLSGLPPIQEIEFRIKLVPGAILVVKSPYRLAPS